MKQAYKQVLWACGVAIFVSEVSDDTRYEVSCLHMC